MQNLYQMVKYFLINSHNWILVMSDVILHVKMTSLTVEDQSINQSIYLANCASTKMNVNKTM